MKRILKFVLWLLLFGVIGGVIGFTGGVMSSEITSVREIVGSNLESILQYMTYIQLAAALIFVISCVVTYFKARRFTLELKKEENFENEELENNIDVLQTRVLFIFSVYSVLAMLLFALALHNDETLLPIVVFLVSFFTVFALYVKTIALIKISNPTKKGDPLTVKFGKDFLNSCDEAEMFSVYKCSFMTFMKMQSILNAAQLVTFLGTIILGLGYTPIIIVSAIVLTENIVYFYYAKKV